MEDRRSAVVQASKTRLVSHTMAIEKSRRDGSVLLFSVGTLRARGGDIALRRIEHDEQAHDEKHDGDRAPKDRDSLHLGSSRVRYQGFVASASRWRRERRRSAPIKSKRSSSQVERRLARSGLDQARTDDWDGSMCSYETNPRARLELTRRCRSARPWRRPLGARPTVSQDAYLMTSSPELLESPTLAVVRPFIFLAATLECGFRSSQTPPAATARSCLQHCAPRSRPCGCRLPPNASWFGLADAGG